MFGSRLRVVGVVVALAAGLGAGCSLPGQARRCAAEPGSAIDLADGTRARGPGEAVWTDRRGCILRPDVLREQSGPEHCGLQTVRYLLTGTPIGQPFESNGNRLRSSPLTVYVRDPVGAHPRESLTGAFRPDAALPADAVDTGFRRRGAALWVANSQPDAVFVKVGATTERWPAGDFHPCE